MPNIYSAIVDHCLTQLSSERLHPITDRTEAETLSQTLDKLRKSCRKVIKDCKAKAIKEITRKPTEPTNTGSSELTDS